MDIEQCYGIKQRHGLHARALQQWWIWERGRIRVFNLRINSFDGFGHSSSTIGLALTNTSGTWANAAAVLAANSGGSLAAAHIFVTVSPANAANGALLTGFAANGGQVPDGGTTVMLLGVALGALGMVRRYASS